MQQGISFADMARALHRKKMVDDAIKGGEGRRALVRLAREREAAAAAAGARMRRADSRTDSHSRVVHSAVAEVMRMVQASGAQILI